MYELQRRLHTGGKRYEVEVDVTYETQHYYGDDDEAKLVERFAQYRVDGVSGSGITEWQYRNTYPVIQ